MFAFDPLRSFNFFLFGDNMRPRISFLVFWSLVASSGITTLADEGASGFIDVQAADVSYEPHPKVPELGYSVLSGDPAEAGVYVIRLKIPPGLTFPPHHHDQDRHITVISGVWAFGRGRSGSCDDTVSLTAGAYVMHPKGGIHYDGACGKEPVEVQIIGEGPVKTTWIDEPE
jgi:quercetin dioxygenase-like cupin family protein